MKASNVLAPPKKSAADRDVPDLEEAIEEEDQGDAADPEAARDDEADIKDDKYIKKPKTKPAAKKTGTNGESDDGTSGGRAKGKGRGGETSARGAGRGRGRGRGK